MAELFIALDTSKPVGQRLAPEVRAEIAELAPSNVPNGSIGTAKLADSAVTAAKIDTNAVGSDEIAPGAVLTTNIGNGQITGAKVQDGTLSQDKLGVGKVSGFIDGVPTSLAAYACTAAQYAAITDPSPTVLYFIS